MVSMKDIRREKMMAFEQIVETKEKARQDSINKSASSITVNPQPPTFRDQPLRNYDTQPTQLISIKDEIESVEKIRTNSLGSGSGPIINPSISAIHNVASSSQKSLKSILKKKSVSIASHDSSGTIPQIAGSKDRISPITHERAPSQEKFDSRERILKQLNDFN